MKKPFALKVVLSAVLITATGCATAEVVVLSAKGKAVKVAKAEPGKNCEEIGPIEGGNGSGCGLYGAKGTYGGAYNDLRNQAAANGANYVRMDSQIPPHSEKGCFDNSFIIRGVAFLCK